MIYVKRATKDDIEAIRHLSAKYGHKLEISDGLFNNKDIALQARLESGELLGFVWAGLMANNTIAYVDKVMVDPGYPELKILPPLYKELYRIGKKRGVKQAFGIIKQDQYHDKSALAALHMGWGGDATSYTYVYTEMNFMESQLKELGVI